MCKHRLHIRLFAESLDSFGLCGSAQLPSAFAGAVSGCSGSLLQCLALCLGAARDPKHHLWPALPSRTQKLLAEVSPCRHSAGTGALMQRVCSLASLFDSAIHGLSKILQWGEQQWLRLLRLVVICSTVLFPCLRLSACSHSGLCVPWGPAATPPAQGVSRPSLFLSLDLGGLWKGFALRL